MTAEVAESIAQVRESASTTKSSSGQLLSSAGERSQKAEELRTEVADFLMAMARAGDRRLHPRFDVDLPASIHLPGSFGGADIHAEGRTINLSQGGLALRMDVKTDIGAEAEVSIRGERLRGRVIEASRGVLRLQFRHDQATADLVDRLIARLAA
ncbi:PilZ domain-containing protein [Marinibaculum pumilum]|uniref:PilZ domain-containing protein n=1 Tax=Marinibaculum pumilum TaxID=1766165 RepID=A0ABV7L7W2_9PROT